MSLFQNSVLNKYLKGIDSEKTEKAWNTFKNHFHNPEIQENIRNSKEEQYQGEFLIDLFVNVFGYVKNPNPNFNLTTELKNIKGAKKTDGAILQDEKAIAVIELKGTNTVDLGKVENQAFGYKNNQPGCTYVITSNFEKLRFYIDNAVEYEEFNLFQLTKERFDTLYLCLSEENLLKGIAKQIKDESLTREETVTKQLYKDYSQFRNEIFDDIQIQNPEYDKLTLFKKTQKLLDRFLFIFFAEDRLLLPPNSIREIVTQWTDLRDKYDEYQPLYSRFKKYFGYMNTGYEGKKYEIFAYNGGLFAPDEILDTIKISDDLLYKHTVNLSNYDFESEVSVNILGHIFEHSLTEIETIQAQLEGHEIDKSKTKRKKDGVFYTPKYITKYIVDNTVGKLCEEKKIEIGIDENEFDKERKGRKKATLKKLTAQLDNYRNWLLHITICDPACGSGAFLNQALEFLIEEHRYIDELKAKLLGDALVFSEVQNDILENNIFGVDINEESVEIAKLSLWLRTAKKGRKLTSLNSNIKCGNSLISDSTSSKYLNWTDEFSEVFKSGGFDVIIGNPPYVNAIQLKKSLPAEEFKYLKENYETAKGTVDLYIYFFEKGIQILKKNGLLSYITPNRFLSASYGKALRTFFIDNVEITSLIDYSDKKVFVDASTYPVISFLKNSSSKNYNIITGKFDEISKTLISREFPSSNLTLLEDYIMGFLLNDKLEISQKAISKSVPLSEVGKINATSTAKEADDYSILINEDDDNGYKLINTGTIDPFHVTWGSDSLTDKGKKYLKPYLSKNHDIISSNRINLYDSNKIVISKIGLQCEAFYDEKGEYASINTNCIHSFQNNYLPEYVLCWINSKLYNYIFECLFDGLRMSGGYLLFSAPNLKNTYIKNIEIKEQNQFKDFSTTITECSRNCLLLINKFINRLKDNLDVDKITKKIKQFYLNDFKSLLKELKKQKIELSLDQQDDWEEYFEKFKGKIIEQKNQIDEIESIINSYFYSLYDLSTNEIAKVENAMQ